VVVSVLRSWSTGRSGVRTRRATRQTGSGTASRRPMTMTAAPSRRIVVAMYCREPTVAAGRDQLPDWIAQMTGRSLSLTIRMRKRSVRRDEGAVRTTV
jgi:hypothetical protein